MFFFHFWYLREISNILPKKKPHRSSITEVIDSERYDYLNPQQGFFLKTLWK